MISVVPNQKNISDVLNKIKTQKYHFIHKRLRTPFFTYIVWQGGSQRFNENIGFNYMIELLYLDQEIAASFDDWQNLKSVTLENLKKDPKVLSDLIHDSYASFSQVEKLIKEIKAFDVSRLTKEKVLEYLKKYNKLMLHFGGYVFLPLFIEKEMEEQLRQLIKNKFTKNNNEVFQVLTTPMKLGAAALEEFSLLDVAIAKHMGDDIKEAIDRHLNEFAWMSNNSHNARFTTRKKIEKQLTPLLKSDPVKRKKSILSENENLKNKFNEYRNELVKLPNSKVLIDTLQEAIYYRSWRSERYYWAASQLDDFFRKIAKLLELTDSSDIFYLSPDEIIDCLDLSRKPSLELIKERRAGYMVYSSKDRMIVISGKELKVLKQSIQIFEKIDEGLVKGQTAYPGKVRGKVVVIGSKTELGKVQKDNILITTSTTVDYIPYLKKVKAIVADEGGVLSHASVISRELRIPCIIGTGHGTYSFKDGDEVEVDTEKGVVRILNK